MNKDQVNKELTKLLGECWHVLIGNHERFTGCSTCNVSLMGTDERISKHINPDYFTDTGYGKLRDIYDGWDEDRQESFICSMLNDRLSTPSNVYNILHAFHRDNLALLMLDFLNNKAS